MLYQQLADVLRKLGASGINASDFSPARLPAHLRMNFVAVDRRGNVIDSDKDLHALQLRSTEKIQSSVAQSATATLAETRSSTWTADTLGDIADEVVTEIDGQQVVAYPALVATAQGLHVQAMPTSADAERMMLTSTLSMLLHDTVINDKQMLNGLPLQQRVAVDHYPHGGAAGLIADAKTAAVRDLMMEAGGPVRTPADFQKLKDHVQTQAPARVRQQVVALAPSLVEYLAVAQDLEQWRGEAIDDMKRQLDFLLPAHALSTQGLSRLQHLPRYVKAMRIRLEAMDRNPDRDADLQDEITSVQEYLDKRLSRLSASATKTKEVKDIQWMIQELRVGLFAQQLGTPRPVSARRIMKLIDKLG